MRRFPKELNMSGNKKPALSWLFIGFKYLSYDTIKT